MGAALTRCSILSDRQLLALASTRRVLFDVVAAWADFAADACRCAAYGRSYSMERRLNSRMRRWALGVSIIATALIGCSRKASGQEPLPGNEGACAQTGA
jgi:hypothetical protein